MSEEKIKKGCGIIERTQEKFVLSIAMVGEARSLFIEAIDEAENGNIEKGYEIYDKGCQLLQEAQCHQDLKIEFIQTVKDSLLYSHMQSHMLNAETLRILTLKL